MTLRRHLLFFIAFASLRAFAAGPSELATTSRKAWPDSLATPEGFDQASRAEILAFAAALRPLKASDLVKPDFAALSGIKNPDVAMIEAWLGRALRILAQNFKAASAGCKPSDQKSALLCVPAVVSSEVDLLALSQDLSAALPERFKPWHADAARFYERYVKEQLRLAALFGRISSEILTLDDAELTGFEMQDKTFRLTFDDGPTPKGGHTDSLIAWMTEKKLNGHFFALGTMIEQRQKKSADLEPLYKGQCLASHGYEHNSHAKLATWKDSISKTDALLKGGFPAQGPFHWRPPYGQRLKDAAAFLKDGGRKVMLWNIDSQDWHGKMDAEGMRGRVVSLMLAWRRGILLFHDVHDKVQRALPRVIDDLEGSGVRWLDCAKDPV